MNFAGDDGPNSLAGGDTDDKLRGGGGDDKLRGGGGHDVMSGGQGDDAISGGQGNDYIYGGAGNDLINGAKGDDTVDYRGNFSDYTFSVDRLGRIHITDSVAGRDGSDIIQNVEHFHFQGGNETYDVVNNHLVHHSDMIAA